MYTIGNSNSVDRTYWLFIIEIGQNNKNSGTISHQEYTYLCNKNKVLRVAKNARC